MDEEEGGHLDGKEAKRQSGREAVCEALHSQPGRFHFTSTAGCSMRVGGIKAMFVKHCSGNCVGGALQRRAGRLGVARPKAGRPE